MVGYLALQRRQILREEPNGHAGKLTDGIMKRSEVREQAENASTSRVMGRQMGETTSRGRYFVLNASGGDNATTRRGD